MKLNLMDLKWEDISVEQRILFLMAVITGQSKKIRELTDRIEALEKCISKDNNGA